MGGDYMEGTGIWGLILSLSISALTGTTPVQMEAEAQMPQTEAVIEIAQTESETTQTESIKEIKNTELPLVYDPVQTPVQPKENAASVGEYDRKSWWFRRNNDHLPPSAQNEIAIGAYDAYYLGDTQHKVIYLTFDEGYENGYTSQILDILKANDVTAAFFVTKSYIESCPDLVNRMVEEGHIVGNHSSTHPEMAGLSSDEILAELNGCADAFQKVTGVEMPRYFRPPSGVYSIHSLAQTQAAGYKTIFWSFAYQDWDTENQPGVQAAYDMVMNHYHNGCIMLLHAVSQSNTEALDQMLKSLKAQGYVFLSLDQLPAASTI